jgi:dolichol-phosphate mannosyltransferase
MNKLSIIVLAFNEVVSLRHTVEELHQVTDYQTTKIIISTSVYAKEECREEAESLSGRFDNVRVYVQNKPFVAAAVLEALNLCDSTFIIYMSSDKETPATLVPLLLEEIDNRQLDIVSASRWIVGGSFYGYGIMKLFVSKSAQLLCKIIYMSSLTEFTYGFRIYRKSILINGKFKETKHPFFLESLLVPLRLGSKIAEIPVKWTPRTEGESVVDIKTLLTYLRPIIAVRLTRKRNLLADVPN